MYIYIYIHIHTQVALVPEIRVELRTAGQILDLSLSESGDYKLKCLKVKCGLSRRGSRSGGLRHPDPGLGLLAK